MVKLNPNSQIITSCEVNRLDGRYIETSKGRFEVDWKVVCGGLFSDRLAKKEGLKSDVRIVGFRGDYYDLTEHAKVKVKNLIYPVPNPEFPFLGVHFTRMTNGTIECGPNAVFTFKREGYRKTDFDLKTLSRPCCTRVLGACFLSIGDLGSTNTDGHFLSEYF